MGKLLTTLRNAPKRTSALFAMIVAAVIVPAALFAWGPERPTYTIEHPADHVTFNSITNNPNIGDERNFVGIRESGTTGTWSDNMTVQPGKEYVVRMYVHNNAAANLNKVAENVTAKFNLPANTAKSLQVNGFLSSTNASPQEVYDHAIFSSTQDFNLAYQAGTLKYYNNVFGSAGTAISESAFTSAGALLGYDKLDGKIPGCFEYAGYLTFTVKPQFAPTANHTVTKEVSKHGENKWVENYAAQPGETVDYLIEYKNIGDAQNDNVMISDKLPTGTSYVAGSTVLGNSLHPAGLAASDNIVNAGINIGSYAKGGGAWIIFSAKVAANAALPACGSNTLINTARATTDYGWKEDTATVVVPKECQPVNIQVCELATKKIVTIDEKNFDAAKYSKNLDDCKEVPVKIQVCEISTKKIVTIDEKDFDNAKYSKNLDDCKVPGKITVCEIATKTIITIDETTFDAAKHSMNLKDCATPVTPPELPHTGAGSSVASALGLGALIASASYYIASRRLLGNR